MERTLNLDAIRSALGVGGTLPSPEELQKRLATAEIKLFLGEGEVDDELLAAAWYLHSVGTSRQALELYDVDRQLRANQIAAHIFDLALQVRDLDYTHQLQVTFAAQVSSLRGEVNPNAIALYRRLPPHRGRLRESPGVVSLEIGASLLALDRGLLFSRLRNGLRDEARRLSAALSAGFRAEPSSLSGRLSADGLAETVYAAAAGVIEAVYELLVHLTYNRRERIDKARALLVSAIEARSSRGDLDSRWVAAHLLDLIDDLDRISVWSLLPPTVPQSAGRAMTLGQPPILALWPPQVDLLSGDPSPLDPALRRLVLSLPTSAGKTLIAQYLVAAHLSSASGAVCVVVPTHSLAREVKRDLDRRLGVVNIETTGADPFGLFDLDVEPRRAVVMTPEKLGAMLRADPVRVLASFSLFVIDEAHLVGDRERGWVLESVVSFLHEQTRSTNHRLVLLSAALGNRAHFKAWMSSEMDEATAFHNDWRGPRRIHAVFTSQPDWQQKTFEEPRTSRGLRRQTAPLYGRISVRTGSGVGHVDLKTTEPIGVLVRKERSGEWIFDSQRSTPQYRQRVFVAEHLGRFGNVLVVESTKKAAQLFAGALADELPEDPRMGGIAMLAATRLGEGHPLVSCLKHGVGFHHAALPEDIQAELEDAMKAGELRFLVSTTTLVEGINLPVRSVLIGSRGFHTSEGQVETLDSSKLLNAIGRAGRAGKESEGWIVLTVPREFSPSDFEALEARDEELQIGSRLATQDALEALQAFEDLHRRTVDAVFQRSGREAEDFVSYVWFLASALEELEGSLDAGIEGYLGATLAWQQLTPDLQDRWIAVSRAVADAYDRQEPKRRRRWATTGTSLPTAAGLESLVEELQGSWSSLSDPRDPVEVFRLVSAHGRLARMIDLSAGFYRPFRRGRSTPREEQLDVDLAALALDWLQGAPLVTIGEHHLGAVDNEDYRYEQLSEFSTQVLEHLLPWLLGILLGWSNENRESSDPLCPNLPAHFRYGVSSASALELMAGGVRSRRLAQEISKQFTEQTDSDDLRSWLAALGLSEWRQLFLASPSELADLLYFTRARDARITSRALSGELVEVPLAPALRDVSIGEVSLHPVEGDPPPKRIGAWRSGNLLGWIAPAFHGDLSQLLGTGVPLFAELVIDESGGRIQLRVRDPEGDATWFDS